MNDDREQDMERTLQRLRPAALPEEVAARLREEPAEERLTTGDRILACFTACGALAACMIVGLMVWQLAQPQPPRAGANEWTAQQRLVAEYQRLELAAR